MPDYGIRLLGSIDSLRPRYTVHHLGLGQRIVLQESDKPLPLDTTALGAAAQPLAPARDDALAKLVEAPKVATDPVIAVVTAQLQYQLLVLPPKLGVSMLATPHINPLESSCEPLRGALALDHPVAFAGSAPIVSKSQQIKGARCRAICPTWPFRVLRQAFESNHTGFLWVQGQTLFAESLWQDVHHSLGVVFTSAYDDGVVCESAQHRLPLESWLDHALEPRVKDLVKEQV